MTRPAPGRPRSPTPRATVCLRLSAAALAYYRAEADRRNAAEPERGRPVGYTEVIREVLERAARPG